MEQSQLGSEDSELIGLKEVSWPPPPLGTQIENRELITPCGNLILPSAALARNAIFYVLGVPLYLSY
jgi:hypothetical protein